MEYEMPLKNREGWIKVALIPCSEEEFERHIRDAVDYEVSRESPPSKTNGETVVYYDAEGKPIGMKSWFLDLKTGKEGKWFYKIIPFSS